jgi:glucokinase
MTVISIDVGGTGMKCALVDEHHRVLHTERHRTGRERGPDAVVETILGVAEGLAAKAEVRAAGIVVPGVVDEVRGVARYAANLGFKNVPLRELVERRLGIPAVLGHDVRAGGLAEARLGAGRGKAQVLVVPIGTGIAAAHVVNGMVNGGAHGAYGEIGHIVVRPGGAKCGCGQYGCLEAHASASALERQYFERTGEVATAAEIAGKVRTEKPAKRIWTDLIDALSDGLLTGQALYDPELIVIGGGLSESGELLLNPLRRALKKKATFHQVPRIVRAKLGDEAGCLGAALLALEWKP